jgi:transporter family-2 protein
MTPFFVSLSLLAGALLAVQAGANNQLAKATGGPLAATTIQVALACLLLLSVAAVSGTLLAINGLGGVP